LEESVAAIFKINLPSCALQAQTAGSSETFFTIYQGTRRYIPEDPNVNNDRRENDKSYTQFRLHILSEETN
jgi:hypothetical protein